MRKNTYGININYNSQYKLYQLSILGKYIYNIKENDLINNYEDYLDDPMNPDGIIVATLNAIDKVKKDGWYIEKYADIKTIRMEVIKKISELFDTVNAKERKGEI